MTFQKLACPTCGRALPIPAAAIGKHVRCPDCSALASILGEEGRVVLRACALLEEVGAAPAVGRATRPSRPAPVQRPTRRRRGSRAAGNERPGLVLVAAIVEVFGSLQWLAGGAAIMLAGGWLASSGSFGAGFGVLFTLLGALLLLLGAVFLWAGLGLLEGNKAARTTSLVTSGFGLLLAAVCLLVTARGALDGLGALVLVQPILAFAWPAFLIYCLVNRESARWFESRGRSGRLLRARRRHAIEAKE